MQVSGAIGIIFYDETGNRIQDDLNQFLEEDWENIGDLVCERSSKYFVNAEGYFWMTFMEKQTDDESFDCWIDYRTKVHPSDIQEMMIKLNGKAYTVKFKTLVV